MQLLTRETPLTRLHRSDSVAIQQLWSQAGRLLDLGEAAAAFNQMINRSSMKQSGSDFHVFKLAFEHVDDISNTDFKYVWLLHFNIHMFNNANSGHFMFSCDLAILAITFFRFYWNLVTCLQLGVTLLVQNLA